MRILAGDVGGTTTRLAVCVLERGRPRPVHTTVVPSEPSGDLAALLRVFAERNGPFDVACIGVPGPVEGDVVRTTNLPWRLDARALARAAGVARLRLVNDLVAHARGLDELDGDALATLHDGEPDTDAPRVIVAPGTGLGVAWSVRVAGRPLALASEAGHLGFAPAEPEEYDLARALAARYGRASWERVVSGPGLAAIDRMLAAGESTGERSPEEISRAALERRDERAERALGLFARALARFAGDLGLALRARGGVFVGGGIAPAILPRLRAPDVLAAFTAKGRLTELARRLPLRVVLDERVGLLGAARLAVEGA
ncbi:MAG: glucokinase [Acidobacteriota bacterium]